MSTIAFQAMALVKVQARESALIVSAKLIPGIWRQPKWLSLRSSIMALFPSLCRSETPQLLSIPP